MIAFKGWLTAAVGSALGWLLVFSPATFATTETTNLANCQAALDGAIIDVSTANSLRITFTSCPAAVTSTLYLAASAPVGTADSVDIDGARFIKGFDGSRWKIDGYAVTGASNPLPEGTYQVFFRIYDRFNDVAIFNGSFTVNVTPPVVNNEPPPPVIQQFGHPAAGTCDEAQPPGLDWSGVASGGWHVSWAQWMNDGNGGAVCTRTLYYSTSQNKWVVG